MMIEILNSAEVRWFFHRERLGSSTYGPSPPMDVLEWFFLGCKREWEPSKRIDMYLHLPGCETTSVKLREGKFEIKASRGSSETVNYSHSVSGRSDAWCKWSYGKEAVGPWYEALLQESYGWIEVTKWRILRKFSLDETRPKEVGVDERPRQGCDVELTVIRANESYWWTLGLEAFGPADVVRENLRLGSDHFFATEKPPIPLDTTHSCAYPIWLNAVAVPLA